MNLAKAVCIILKVPPAEIKTKETNYKSKLSYWDAFLSPKILGDMKILQRLNEIDPSQISEDIIEQIQTLMTDESVSE